MSILSTIKKMLGIVDEYTHFDTDILIYINTAVSILSQIGVGSSEGLTVNENTSWTDYIGTDARMEMVKTYIYMKVKVMFDPPQSSAAMDAIDKTLAELEWRINSYVEHDNN